MQIKVKSSKEYQDCLIRKMFVNGANISGDCQGELYRK